MGQACTTTIIIPSTSPPRQSTHDHALLVEDIQMPPLHRLDVVVTGHRGSCPSPFLRPQLGRFLNLQEKCGGLRLKPRLHHPPALPKPQQLSKGLFRCHRSPSSATRQATFLLGTARNLTKISSPLQLQAMLVTLVASVMKYQTERLRTISSDPGGGAGSRGERRRATSTSCIGAPSWQTILLTWSSAARRFTAFNKVI